MCCKQNRLIAVFFGWQFNEEAKIYQGPLTTFTHSSFVICKYWHCVNPSLQMIKGFYLPLMNILMFHNYFTLGLLVASLFWTFWCCKVENFEQFKNNLLFVILGVRLLASTIVQLFIKFHMLHLNYSNFVYINEHIFFKN